MSRKGAQERAEGPVPRPRRRAPSRVLCIGGSDSGGGAGLQADLRTVAAYGAHGLTAVTAVTAQDSRGVSAVLVLPPAMVRAQLEAVLGDIGADAVKIGMLAAAPVVLATAATLRRHGVRRIVLDPVLRSTSGRELLDAPGRAEMVRRLFPLADLVTPNLSEAGVLLGRRVTGVEGMRTAAIGLLRLGARAVLIKGGHLRGEPADFFADGARTALLPGRRVPTPHTHGTGCVLSTAIACLLAEGCALERAVRLAKRFVTAALRAAYPLGGGRGTLNPPAAGRALRRVTPQ